MPRRVLLMVIPAAVLALAAVLVAVLASRGGGDPGGAVATRGQEVFAEAGCAGCHTLSAAKATGTEGPSLDLARPDAERVARQVRQGGRGMPAFAGRLSEDEVGAVAQFVARAAAESAGTAPVPADFRPDERTVAGCGADTACLEQAYANVAFRAGPQRALAEVEEGMRTDPATNADCHRIVHSVGAGALARFGGSVARTLAAGSATCWSGYYHGVVERAFAGVSDDQLAARARDLCADPGIRQDPFVTYQCVHGLGHGLMIRTGLDLPKALADCDGLATDWDRQSCTGGVFMENLNSSYGTKSAWLRDDDPLYPCTEVAERHKPYCYLMVTSRILPMVGRDWAKVAGWCRRAEEGWQATCFQSMGRDASGDSQRDVARIRRSCAPAGDQLAECLYGAARDIVSNDAKPDGAAALCASSPAAVRGRCYDGMGTIIGTLHPDLAGRRAACARWAGPYVADCRRGAVAT